MYLLMQATVPPSPEHSLCSGNAGVSRHLHARAAVARTDSHLNRSLSHKLINSARVSSSSSSSMEGIVHKMSQAMTYLSQQEGNNGIHSSSTSIPWQQVASQPLPCMACPCTEPDSMKHRCGLLCHCCCTCIASGSTSSAWP